MHICSCGWIGVSDECGVRDDNSHSCPICYGGYWGDESLRIVKEADAFRFVLFNAGSVRSAFIASILERPDDEAPRLVFADWLDENGESAIATRIRQRIKELNNGKEKEEEEKGCAA